MLAYGLLCVALGLLMAHFALIGLIPAQPVDWLKEQAKRATAALMVLAGLVAQLIGRKVY